MLKMGGARSSWWQLDRVFASVLEVDQSVFQIKWSREKLGAAIGGS
jgi:hypothetical protein